MLTQGLVSEHKRAIVKRTNVSSRIASILGCHQKAAGLRQSLQDTVSDAVYFYYSRRAICENEELTLN
jgi:hypothetical protein